MHSVVQHRVAHISSWRWDVAARRLFGSLLVLLGSGLAQCLLRRYHRSAIPFSARTGGFFEDDKRLA